MTSSSSSGHERQPSWVLRPGDLPDSCVHGIFSGRSEAIGAASSSSYYCFVLTERCRGQRALNMPHHLSRFSVVFPCCWQLQLCAGIHRVFVAVTFVLYRCCIFVLYVLCMYCVYVVYVLVVCYMYVYVYVLCILNGACCASAAPVLLHVHPVFCCPFASPRFEGDHKAGEAYPAGSSRGTSSNESQKRQEQHPLHLKSFFSGDDLLQTPCNVARYLNSR